MALNLANTVTITAKTAYANVTTVSANVLSNAAASGQIHKINNIMISNYTGNTTSANVMVNRNGTGVFNMANTITIPPYSLLTILAKDSQIYLEEGDALQIFASTNNSLHMITGYELLS